MTPELKGQVRLTQVDPFNIGAEVILLWFNMKRSRVRLTRLQLHTFRFIPITQYNTQEETGNLIWLVIYGTPLNLPGLVR